MAGIEFLIKLEVKKYGVTKQTLIYYEKEGLIKLQRVKK